MTTDALLAARQPTTFIESVAPEIVELAHMLTRQTPRESAVALFEWVRDQVRYEPRDVFLDRNGYRATAVLQRRSGYCVQKAVLLAALCRAADIPARLGFVDVRNHKTPRWLLQLMGTDVFVFHGYVVLYLDGVWVKAAPTLDTESAQRAGADVVELDGVHDAMLHPVDPTGQPYIEHVCDRGWHDDVPYGEIVAALHRAYPQIAERFETQKATDFTG